jgi:ABC-type sugar transport system ATPase subunit
MSAIFPQAAGEILFDGPPVRSDRPPAAQLAGICAVYQTINLISGRSAAGTARCITRQHIF